MPFQCLILISTISQVKFHFTNKFYDITAVSETCLHDKIPNSVFQIFLDTISLDMIVVIMLEPVGVGVLIHNSFNAQIFKVSEHSPGIPEYSFVEVRSQCFSTLLTAIVYRSLKTPFKHGNDLEKDISINSSIYVHKIILGDFNANLLLDSLFVKELSDSFL